MPYDLNLQAEQRILKYSILTTALISFTGVVIGVFTHSAAIIFDGAFGGVDCLFSAAALYITRLIEQDAHKQVAGKGEGNRRFQYGFWHFEPLVLALNSIALIVAVGLAFYTALRVFLQGGHTPDFGPAVGFAFFASVTAFAMAIYEYYKNKTIRSSFIDIDVKNWLVSGSISIALFLAFVLALFLESTSLQWLLPYVDSVILMLIALILVPLPISSLVSALSEIFMITPASLDQHIRAIVDQAVKNYGFLEAKTYIAKVGRSQMIEIHFVVPQDFSLRAIGDLDKIRNEVGQEIGGEGPERWLTIVFTGEEKWAY